MWRKKRIQQLVLEIECAGDPESHIKLIFLHGGPGMDPSYFKGIIEPLSAIGELIIYRQGQCPLESIDGLIQELSNVIANFNKARIILIGHSFGGALALEWIKQHSANDLCGLVLVSQVTKPGWNTQAKTLNVYKEIESTVQLVVEGKAGDEFYKAETTAYAPIYFRKNKIEEGRRALERVRYNDSLRSRIYETYLTSFNLESSLEKIDVPCLVIAGTNDCIVDYDHSKSAVEILPEGKFISFATCGHFPFIEEPELFNHTIEDFVATVTVPANTEGKGIED